MNVWNALIRTHHITSRKKVAKLHQAAAHHNVLALLRYGGAPGIMYVEGQENGVQQWVEAVHNLRYKDYQLVTRPAPVQREKRAAIRAPEKGDLSEIDTVKDFGQAMRDRDVYAWWRKGMGFNTEDLL